VNEPAEDPVGQASAKVVQYVSLVTMAAEAIAQRRQQPAPTPGRPAPCGRSRPARTLRPGCSGNQSWTHAALVTLAWATPVWPGQPRKPGSPPTRKPSWRPHAPRTGCASCART
jgi:hypothetical protein